MLELERGGIYLVDIYLIEHQFVNENSYRTGMIRFDVSEVPAGQLFRPWGAGGKSQYSATRRNSIDRY